MNNRMLAKQNHLSRGTYQPLSFGDFAIQSQLLNCLTNGFSGTRIDHANESVLNGAELDSACGDKRTLEIIQEVTRILNADTQTNEVLRKTASRPSGCIDGCVSMWRNLNIRTIHWVIWNITLTT